MKRAGRWLFNFAAVVSVVMCVGLAVIWIRSRTHQDAFSFAWPGRLIEIGWQEMGPRRIPHLVIVHNWPNWRSVEHDSGGRVRGLNPSIVYAGGHREEAKYPLGIRYLFEPADWVQFLERDELRNPVDPPRYPVSIVYFDSWPALFLIPTPLPMLWLIVVIRRRNRVRMPRKGLCVACGYDLRATPDRCPECGTVPKVRGPKIHTDL
jgi:hypothetical protein